MGVANDGGPGSAGRVCGTSASGATEPEPVMCRVWHLSTDWAPLAEAVSRTGSHRDASEHSRRPQHCPRQTAPSVEERIAQLRRQRPDWGARKLQPLLRGEGIVLPVITVHRVLLRHGLVRPRRSSVSGLAALRARAPNQLWQMDFKSPKGCQQPVGPLSVMDDHSRFVIALEKTGSTRTEAVQERLEHAFLSAGVPEAMLMDHGTPVECAGAQRLDEVTGVVDETRYRLSVERDSAPPDPRQGRTLPSRAGDGPAPTPAQCRDGSGVAGPVPLRVQLSPLARGARHANARHALGS